MKDPLVGTRIAHYEIESLLGVGGMGKVYKARNVRLDKTCALKILPPELALQDPALLERFIREARSAAAVEHPNVLPVNFVGRVEENCFIEMQYVDGGTLQDVLAKRGQLDPASAARVVWYVANALQAAHEKGIIHRDIKPSNVMLSKRGQVFVADFGLAKVARAKGGLTQEGELLGTPLYMSPEQTKGQVVDHRSDIYSLGALFYEMLAGSPPYTADSPLVVLLMHRESPIPDVRQAAPDAPPQIAAMIQKMMAKKPEERYQNCAEVVRELKDSLAAPGISQPGVVVVPSFAEPGPFRFRRKKTKAAPVLVGLLVLAMLAAAGVLGFLYKDEIVSRWGSVFEGQGSGPARTTTAQTAMAPGTPRTEAGQSRLAQPPLRPGSGQAPAVAVAPKPDLSAKSVRAETRHPEPSIPPGWTSETKRVKVATPEGEVEKDITYYTNSIGMKLVLIPAGEFVMGGEDSPEALSRKCNLSFVRPEAFKDEKPQHTVRITKPFLMGAYEVTQSQYERVIGHNPAKNKSAENPVEMVSWDDSVGFCKRLSVTERVTYRLPSEAEWEYACRAGTTTPFYSGDTISVDLANYNGSVPFGQGEKGRFRQQTLPVGTFPPNPFGLYDMHGNVWEWCNDRLGPYETLQVSDPQGPQLGPQRVVRGGAWDNIATFMRSAFRTGSNPAEGLYSRGFRAVCELSEASKGEAPHHPAYDERQTQAALQLLSPDNRARAGPLLMYDDFTTQSQTLNWSSSKSSSWKPRIEEDALVFSTQKRRSNGWNPVQSECARNFDDFILAFTLSVVRAGQATSVEYFQVRFRSAGLLGYAMQFEERESRLSRLDPMNEVPGATRHVRMEDGFPGIPWSGEGSTVEIRCLASAIECWLNGHYLGKRTDGTFSAGSLKMWAIGDGLKFRVGKVAVFECK